MDILYYILEEYNGKEWTVFLYLAAKRGTFRSLLEWSSGWFTNNRKIFVARQGASQAEQIKTAPPPFRLRRVPFCQYQGLWDGEKMIHKPICNCDGDSNA